jgi:hypothetical protein
MLGNLQTSPHLPEIQFYPIHLLFKTIVVNLNRIFFLYLLELLIFDLCKEQFGHHYLQDYRVY